MYGRHINTLNVYTKSSSNKENLIWTKNGNQGNKWIKGEVNINSYEGYNIIFEAIRGTDYEVFIDLSFNKILNII